MTRYHPLHPHPDAVPPEQVRFTDLHIEPWESRDRARLHARLTPFTRPPNIEIELRDPSGVEIASAYIVENIDYDFVITLHLRRQPSEPLSRLSLIARISYPDEGVVHQQTLELDF